MDRYAAGDDLAFAEVYDGVAPPLLSYLRRQTGHSDAEDVLQQTLLQMHRARGTFIAQSAVMPWAFAIARRLLIDQRRRRGRDVLAAAERVDVDRAATTAAAHLMLEAKEAAATLGYVLARLPESQRRAFELMRLDGLSHLEAAQALGVSVNAVKLRAHRAYVALRAALGASPRGHAPGTCPPLDVTRFESSAKN
ncbi:MAG TPA: RNA polymerase sigma factor [Polyangiaceae bacterium]|nr:RNA polymerase sigma factor [Polyangiaceae bacterium]